MSEFSMESIQAEDALAEKYAPVCQIHAKWWPCYVGHDEQKKCVKIVDSEATAIVREFHLGTLSKDDTLAYLQTLEMEVRVA